MFMWGPGSGEIAQWLKGLAVHSEDQGIVSNTHNVITDVC